MSAFDLIAAGPEDRDRWNGFVWSHAEGHFFQSWEWGELQEGLGAQAVRLALADRTNGALVGCLQLFLFETGERVFGVVPRGPVAQPDPGEEAAALIDAAVAVSLAHGATLLRVEPQWADTPDRRAVFTRRGFATARQHIMPPRTILVDLRPPPEAIWAAFRSTTRNRIRLAGKRGVEVRVGGERDIETFIDLVAQTHARHGLRPGRPEQFRLAMRLFGHRDLARLFLAEHEGEVVAGIFVFLWGATATYLWGASAGSEGARQANPNQLLHWRAIQWARERGSHVYDLFGVPDHEADVLEAEYGQRAGGWWNLYRFKRGFGGRVHRHLGTFDYVPPPR